MSAYLHGDKGYIRLIKCFLSPNLFVQRKEQSAFIQQNQERRNTENSDNLYQLFHPTEPDTLGKHNIS